GAVVLSAVHDLHPDLIAHRAVVHDVGGADTPQQGDLRVTTTAPHDEQRTHQRHEDEPVDHHSRPHQSPRRTSLQAPLGTIADQIERLADTGHDGVAGVHALAAGDALELQAFADVDARRTRHHTSIAADAVARRHPGTRLAVTAGLATPGVVADDEGVFVEQHGLDTRIGAGHRAHLLPEVGE